MEAVGAFLFKGCPNTYQITLLLIRNELFLAKCKNIHQFILALLFSFVLDSCSLVILVILVETWGFCFLSC